MKILATLRTLRTLNRRAAATLLRVLDKRPIIEISDSGWATSRPQVHVGFASRGGLTSVMTQDDDDAGNARCTMHAVTLANITGLRVVDRRSTAKNEAGQGTAREFVAAPRDAGRTAPQTESVDIIAVGMRPGTCC